MFQSLKQLFNLFSSKQRKQFYALQLLVILMAIMELLSIASIGPFMAIVADPSLLQQDTIYRKVFLFFNTDSTEKFLFMSGVLVLLTLVLSSVISVITTWRMSLFSYKIGSELADSLFSYYLNQNWLFHMATSSAELTKQIATETNRLTQQIINPFMQMNARLVMVVFIATAIILYNPWIAITGVIIFSGGYFVIYKTIRIKLIENGILISKENTNRYRLMNESFGGIKDILLHHLQPSFTKPFEKTNENLANAQANNNAISIAPRYIMELLAFGSMIALVLVLILIYDGELNKVLPALAVYGLAGFKLLPAIQQIFQSMATIKGNGSAFHALKDDLINSKKARAVFNEDIVDQDFTDRGLDKPLYLQLRNIYLTYPGKKEPAINNLSIDIPLNSTIGIAGESGSGKSTIVDILIGLIKPDSGNIYINNNVLDSKNIKEWQNKIGFVPQHIFLSEGSIAENIAFGVDKDDINISEVQNAAKMASLDDFVQTLPDGYDTKVGERGVRLSGGQRQRIGIARALYNNAEILVFDEATSALDGLTEKAIMDAVYKLGGKKTIILIAHRLKTIQNCDIIFLMQQGKVIAQGSYDDLLLSNKMFKKMAEHA